MNRKILLAEDDCNLGTLLKSYLDAKGYETTLQINGKSAHAAFMDGVYDLCILDIMMPEMDGITLARSVRGIDPAIPIIFLTAKNQLEDVLEGFKTGGDDYITKPFAMEELLYRIEAIFRRSAGTAPVKEEVACQIGGYSFDSKRQLLTFNDQHINLTTKESELLYLLYLNRNKVLERNYALKKIWIDDNYFNARSMDVYITRLRKYLKKDPAVKILNIHGRGYRLIC